AARARQPEGWILSADTVVTLEGEIFGKPRDSQQAAEFLRRLSGRTHAVITGLALLSPTDRLFSGTETTDVRFRELMRKDIDQYLSQVDVLDKAGAYSFERGKAVVAAIRGSPSNVIGLPLEKLEALLQSAGCGLTPSCKR